MSTDSNIGQILVGRYLLRRLLGSGAHGRVYLADDLGRGGTRVAFKLVEGLVGGGPRDPAESILRWLRHPNWADVLDAGACGAHDYFQVTRYVQGRSLDKLAGPQPVELVWQVLEDGARVLRALHQQGLIHYDVTPGNLLLEPDGDRSAFVLTDGGLAHVGPVRGVARGTPQYMAPEVTEDRGHDHRTDLYSLGLVAYRLAVGRDPFEGGAGDVLGQRRRYDSPRASVVRPELPPELDDLIADLLARDPNARPFDGNAVLDRVRDARDAQVPEFTAVEGLAAASGGPLVGRSRQLVRFRRTVRELARHLPAESEARVRGPVSHLTDPVVLVRGAPGAGTTRLVSEFASLARDDELPVMLVAGRERAPDRRGPLRRLVDGLSSLGLGEDEKPEKIRLDLRSNGMQREERAHAANRAIEVVIREVERAAERTPFVLLVEDFADLPSGAREAVRVLSRHLLSRAEEPGRHDASPVSLVVDLGVASPDSLLIPDAMNLQRPVIELDALQYGDLQTMCETRFPGLTMVSEDVARLYETCDGMPSTLVAVMSEAGRRGDLRYDTGRWHWDLSALDAYEIRRGLTPMHAEALGRAGPRTRTLLQQLALVESNLGEPVVRALCERAGLEEIPATTLLSVQAQTTSAAYALANKSIRDELLRTLTEDEVLAHAERLIKTLEAHASPETVLERARLLVRVGRGEDAVRLLHDACDDLTVEDRHATQSVLRTALDADESLARGETRNAIAALLDHGPDAVHLATALASTEIAHERCSNAIAIAQTLQSGQKYRDALDFLKNDIDPGDSAIESSLLHCIRAQVLLATQQLELAHDAVREARLWMRRGRSARHTHPGRVFAYLATTAQMMFFRGRLDRAARLLRRATRYAAKDGSLFKRASVLNNLAITLTSSGRPREAQRYFQRALRLMRLIGDTDGVVFTTLNVARLNYLAGDPLGSASLYKQCAALAQRYALHVTVTKALRALALIFDEGGNPTLALSTLTRALRTAEEKDLAARSARLAWDIAPLAAALGESQAARKALAVSARCARQRVTTECRPMHFITSGVSSLHVGNPARFRRRIELAERHQTDLLGENAPLLPILRSAAVALSQGNFAPDLSARPAPRESGRLIYRALAWMAQAGRNPAQLSVADAPYLVHDRARAGYQPGFEQRIAVELCLHVFTYSRAPLRSEAIADIRARAQRAGEKMILARTCALSSALQDSPLTPDDARRFSQAVSLLGSIPRFVDFGSHGLPKEFDVAVQRHAATVRPITSEETVSVESLHALAHRLLVHSGSTDAPDKRLASALRRVLEATALMKAGADVDALLADMTRNTIEITGAERACVVRLEGDTELQIKVATSATEQDHKVSIEDLSHTVIHRVIVSRQALLLHDVFDDEELLGRPSITALSLRSILCVPMLRGETLYGVMYADNTSAAGSFDKTDLEVLMLFAEQAAAALETMRLVADVQASMEELKAMQDRLVRGERLRVIGELSSGVAHEFNNLLTSILARVQLISLNPLSVELKNDLDLIEKASLDAAEVVRRLQSFSRSQRQADFRPVKIEEMCSDAVEFLRPLWATRRRHGRPAIRVQVRCEDDLDVAGDPTELREVLTNLIKNALDALDDGGDITVSAAERDGEIRVRVEDTGSGVPEELLSKVFDPFFTTKGERGTGLGLALSQQIVERHGGSMTIDRGAGGVGTLVSITLPKLEDSASPVLADTATEDTSEGNGSIKVLVVDDDESVREPLCEYLELSGYEVHAARDGSEGLRAAPAVSPDIVISDVGMPGMDGLELCRRLRALLPELPVILISGWASGIKPVQARRAGARALLAKPFAMQQVTELVTSLTSAARN